MRDIVCCQPLFGLLEHVWLRQWVHQWVDCRQGKGTSLSLHLGERRGLGQSAVGKDHFSAAPAGASVLGFVR